MKVLNHVTNGNPLGTFAVINTADYNSDGRYDISIVEMEPDDSEIMGWECSDDTYEILMPNTTSEKVRTGSIPTMEVGEMAISNMYPGAYLLRLK